MLFGGSGPEGMDRRFIRRFIELGGGPREARVAVAPTASEERADTIAHYEESFGREDVQHLETLTYASAVTPTCPRPCSGCATLPR